MENKLRAAIAQGLQVCLGLKPDEKLLIIADDETMDVGRQFQKVACEIVKEEEQVNIISIDQYGDRPLHGIPAPLTKTLMWCSCAIFIASKKGNSLRSESYTLRGPLLKLAEKNGIRYANMPDLTREAVETALDLDQKDLWHTNARLFEYLKGKSEIHVTTEAGTDILVELDPKHKWVNSTSNVQFLNHGFNIPGCEVFTCPKSVHGTLVVDGLLGDHFAKKYGLLQHTPMVWIIENGVIERIMCNNYDLHAEMLNYIKRDENARRIGEVGIGTSIGLKDFIGVMRHDEKVPGIHFAIGDPFGDKTMAKWSSIIHCDAVIKNPTIHVDGVLVFENGEFTIL